jgi:hypothetical protein
VTAFCRSYATHTEALPAVNALLDLRGADVRVLSGEPVRDAHNGAVGAFAGGEQRGGSFADADRDVVTDYPDGVERMRVVGHRSLKRLLTDAGLDEAAAERDVRALHAGRVLVLVNVPEDDAERARALL